MTFLRAQVRPTPRYGEPGGRAALVCRSERPINVSGTIVLIETHLLYARADRWGLTVLIIVPKRDMPIAAVWV